MNDKRLLSIVFLSLAVILITAAQLLMKQATLRHPFERPGDVLPLIKSHWTLLGVTAYGVGSLLWIYGLGKLPFFVVTTFMIMPFALLLIAAFLLYDERPASIQWAGIVLVGLGLIMILAREAK